MTTEESLKRIVAESPVHGPILIERFTLAMARADDRCERLQAKCDVMAKALIGFLEWMHPQTMEEGHSAWPIVKMAQAALDSKEAA